MKLHWAELWIVWSERNKSLIHAYDVISPKTIMLCHKLPVSWFCLMSMHQMTTQSHPFDSFWLCLITFSEDEVVTCTLEDRSELRMCDTWLQKDEVTSYALIIGSSI